MNPVAGKMVSDEVYATFQAIGWDMVHAACQMASPKQRASLQFSVQDKKSLPRNDGTLHRNFCGPGKHGVTARPGLLFFHASLRARMSQDTG